MKRIFFILLLTVFVINLPISLYAVESNYLPLTEGNKWIYTSAISDVSIQIERTIISKTILSGARAYIQETTRNGEVVLQEYISITNTEILLLMQERNKQKIKFIPCLTKLKLPVENGKSWEQSGTINMEENGYSYRYQTLCTYKKVNNVVVPAGTFDTIALFIVLSSSQGEQYDSIVYLANNVGIVKEHLKEKVNDQIITTINELKSYSVK